MARIPKPPKPKRGRQPRCWSCHKIATVHDYGDGTVDVWRVPRFFIEYGEFRMVTVCDSEDCSWQIRAESGTSALADLRARVMRESPIAKTRIMLDLLAEDKGAGQ